jgi:dTDP-4-amino-4,6-dideoxygalactose transaminase
MSYYIEKYGYIHDDFPNAIKFGNQVISIPVHSKISDKDIYFIIKIINKALSNPDE